MQRPRGRTGVSGGASVWAGHQEWGEAGRHHMMPRGRQGWVTQSCRGHRKDAGVLPGRGKMSLKDFQQSFLI